MSEIPAINADLIAHYLAAGDLKNLVSIFDFQRRQMTRAEDLSRAYLLRITQLEKQIGNREDRGGYAMKEEKKLEPKSNPEGKSHTESTNPPPKTKAPGTIIAGLEDL